MSLRKMTVAVFIFLVSFSSVKAQSYLGLGYKQVSGDYGTGVESTLNAFTIDYGYYDSRVFYNIATSYLNLDTEGFEDQSGLGDVVIEGGYVIKQQNDDLRVLPSLTVKLPTADEEKFLGSGETDIGAFLDVQKQCGDFICNVGVGYIFIGDPPGFDYDNTLQLNVGVSRSFQKSGVSAYLNYASAVIDGQDDPMSVSADWFYLFGAETAFYIDATTGLNDAAPDYDIRTGIVNWF